ncbi:MAG: carbohydrate ABC transporter permease, partial [Nocardioides sp.]
AGRLSTFLRVTLPLLWDTVQTAWVYLAILALDVYALVAVMTAGPGGPDNSTQVISLQIAQNGFQFGRAGYASAMGVVLFFLTLLIAAFMLRVSRRDRIEF